MGVYNINAIPKGRAYDVSNQPTQQAYDYYCNPLLEIKPSPPEGSQKFTVMSYNTQHFSGRNGIVSMQTEIVNRYKPNVIGFQEFSISSSIPEVAQSMLVDYPHIVMSAHAARLGIASKIQLTDTTITNYVNQDPSDTETRGYIKTHLEFNGRTLCFIDTHLAYITQSVTCMQMQELLDAAEQEENVIITGDFNLAFKSFNATIYNNSFKIFVDAGYRLANNSPNSGITNTHSSNTNPSSTEDLTTNPDAIIVSPDIYMGDVIFDQIKFTYKDGNPIDHIALVAELYV